MADDDKKPATEPNEAKSGGKGPLKLLVAILLLIAGGGGVAMMAMPKKEKGPEAFGGPWSFPFFDKEFVGNTIDDNFSRYVKFTPTCSYFAYDESYPAQRQSDPDFIQSVDERMSNVVARYRLSEIMIPGSSAEQALAAQLEQAIEPVVFPVHVGDSSLPLEMDPKSGLRPGDSMERFGTFRSAFRECSLSVDANAKSIRLGEGDEVKFKGTETDLEVRSSDGRVVYLDVTRLKSGFKGKVHVGVQGRIRQIHLGRLIAQ